MVFALRTFAAALVAVAFVTFGSPRHALAAPLAEDVVRRLESGATVTFESTVDRGDHRYVGGVAYTIVEADPSELDAMLLDPDAYRAVLPRTKSVESVPALSGDRRLRIRQGNALFEAEYTLRLRPLGGGAGVRFWLDPSEPHGIDDAWGYIRTETLPPRVETSGDVTTVHPRVLVSYGILVDVGASFVRDFLETRLRAALLTVPTRFASFAAEHHRLAFDRTRRPRPRA